VGVGVGVYVGVGVAVGVRVAVGVSVGVAVCVGVDVALAEAVNDGRLVSVGETAVSVAACGGVVGSTLRQLAVNTRTITATAAMR